MERRRRTICPSAKRTCHPRAQLRSASLRRLRVDEDRQRERGSGVDCEVGTVCRKEGGARTTPNPLYWIVGWTAAPESLSIRNVVVFVSEEKEEKAESGEAAVVPRALLHPRPRIVDPSRVEPSDGETSVSDRLPKGTDIRRRRRRRRRHRLLLHRPHRSTSSLVGAPFPRRPCMPRNRTTAGHQREVDP